MARRTASKMLATGVFKQLIDLDNGREWKHPAAVCYVNLLFIRTKCSWNAFYLSKRKLFNLLKVSRARRRLAVDSHRKKKSIWNSQKFSSAQHWMVPLNWLVTKSLYVNHTRSHARWERLISFNFACTNISTCVDRLICSKIMTKTLIG